MEESERASSSSSEEFCDSSDSSDEVSLEQRDEEMEETSESSRKAVKRVSGVPFERRNYESLREEHIQFERLKMGTTTCLVVNENTSRDTVKEWRSSMEEEWNKEEERRTPLGFRWGGKELNSRWAEAAHINIHKDHHSPIFQTERRRNIILSIKEQEKTMGPEAEERVRKYAKEPQDSERLETLKRIFDQKKAKFDKYVETEGLKCWSSVFQSKTPSKAVMRTPLKFDVQAPTRSRLREYSDDPTVVVLSSPIVHLESCAVMPRRNYFLSVRTNFKTSDTNTLSHIPYVGDRNHDEDAFTKELVKLYDEGVHGTRRSYRNGINDRILFEMLGVIEFLARNEPKVRDRYYAALSHLFPDKIVLREIHKKVISLRIRFEDANRLPHPAPRDAYYGLTTEAIRDEVQSSGEDNDDCYRCGNLECERHEKIDPSIVKPYSKPPEAPLECMNEAVPCSFLCHLFFEDRMIHQEKNIRLRRWKNGEWKPFWYKIVVKQSKRKAVKRRGNGRGRDAKRMRMEGSEDEEENEEGESNSSERNEGRSRGDENDEEEEMNEGSEREDDEDNENEKAASTSSRSSRRSRSIAESDRLSEYGMNGDGIEEEERDEQRDSNEVGNEDDSRMSEEKMEEERGEDNEGEKELSERGSGEELMEDEKRKEEEEESRQSSSGERKEKKYRGADVKETESIGEDEDGVRAETSSHASMDERGSCEKRIDEKKEEGRESDYEEEEEPEVIVPERNMRDEDCDSEDEDESEEEEEDHEREGGSSDEEEENLSYSRSSQLHRFENDVRSGSMSESSEGEDDEEEEESGEYEACTMMEDDYPSDDDEDEEESDSEEGSTVDDEEDSEASQNISSDEYSEGEARRRCARELSFMGMREPSRSRRESESSRSDEEEEGWSDESEWKDEVMAEEGECRYVRTRRSFPIGKRDIPPRRWREKMKVDGLPKPFWTKKEDKRVKKALANGQSVCDIVSELQANWIMLGKRRRYRECYQVHAYLQSRGFVTVKQEYNNEPELSTADRLQIQRIWRKFNATTEMKNDHKLTPCFHSGRCDEQKNPPCECFQLDIPCTKFCGCDVRCRIKFPGCMCAPGKCRSKMCPCYFASWECDPDTCKACSCDDNDERVQCQNMPISMGQRKRIFASRSEIAGYGAFIGEDVKKGELIEEYVGEIISVEESERRGHMYDKLRLSYTFTLNEDEVVDATRAGNVARFINHSKFPNCVARVFVVKGDHRIGIFARRDLYLGEELFFNYGYRKEHVEAFTNKEREGCDIALLDTTLNARVEEDDEDSEEEETEDSERNTIIPKKEDRPSRFEKKNHSDGRIFKLVTKFPE